MEFKRLYIKNFLSVGEKPVELLFDNSFGITLIQGTNFDISDKSSNGSGKSTIISAFLYGLYGETLREISKEEYYVNRKAKTDCIVEIEYDNVKIVRKLNKKGKNLGVELWVDNVKKTNEEVSITEAKKQILDHLKTNFKTMSNISVFGQHNFFTFLDIGEAEKRETIENLMNLKDINELEAKAREKLKEEKNKLKNITDKYALQEKYIKDNIDFIDEQNKKYDSYKQNINNDIDNIKLLISKIPDINKIKLSWEEFYALEKEKISLEEEITKDRNLLLSLNEHILEINTKKQEETKNRQSLIEKSSVLNNEKHSLELRLDKARKEYCDPIRIDIEKNKNDILFLENEKNNKLLSISPLDNWQFSIKSVEKDYNKLKNEIDSIKNKTLIEDSICPECFGKIDINNCKNVLHKKEIELLSKAKEISDLKLKYEQDNNRINQERSIINKEYSDKIEAINNANAERKEQLEANESKILNKYNTACNNLSISVIAIEKEIKEFDENIEKKYNKSLSALLIKKRDTEYNLTSLTNRLNKLDIKKPSISIESISKFENDIINYNNQIDEKNKLLLNNPFIDNIKFLSDKLDEYKKELAIILSDLKLAESNIPYYEYALDIFGKEGIKSFIIDQILPVLNEQVEYWMQILYQGAISVKFDNKLNINIINNASNNEMVFSQGSGGEIRRIDLAIMLAFRQVMKISTGKDPNIIWLDEIGDALDEDGINRFYDGILDLAKSSKVFIITHNPYLLSLLNNVKKIKVEKKNGVMQLS